MDDNSFRDRRGLTKMTLEDALERYVTTVTPKNRGQVQERNRISQLQKHPISLCSMDSLQSKDFAAYRDERLEKVSATSVRLELALLSHLFTIAIKEWSLPLTHELKNVRKPAVGHGRDRRLINKEEERLLQVIQREEARSTKLWLNACVRLAIETGMRAGEILTCQWSQVDLQRGCIRLDSTKNGSKRTVPLSLEAVRVLSALPRPGVEVIATFYDTSGLDRAFKRPFSSHAGELIQFVNVLVLEQYEFETMPAAKQQRFAPLAGGRTVDASNWRQCRVRRLTSSALVSRPLRIGLSGWQALLPDSA